ncbi:MAG TPA: peptide deformylase [Bacteroides sp.]|nr:peptide deformylase [Bacteroides sp.]
MVLPVYVYGMSVLRREGAEIPGNSEELQQLILDMHETMRASDGVGLAAPQIGKSMRLFVVDASPMSENGKDPELKEFKKAFINPVILDRSGDVESYEEGCLSIPGVREDVPRQAKVRVEYYDEDWNLKEEEYEGIRARIIQHEYDHLEGILFIDKINPIRRKLISSGLKKISRGKVDIDYQIVYPRKK